MQRQNKYSSIIVTGSMAYDEIMDFPGLFKDHFHPEKLHQINISFALSNIQKQLGGTGTNIAYNLSLALNNFQTPIKLLGAVGKDGKEFIDFLKKNKLNIEGIIVDKKLYSSTGKVITDKHDNQIWGFYYGASIKSAKHDLKKNADQNSLVIIPANHPDAFLHFQKQSIKQKMDYLYDPGMTLTWIKDKDLFEGVMHAKYLIGNDYEIAMIMKRLKKTVNELIKTGLEIITTLGKDGVRYESIKSKVHTVKAYKIKKIIDPTGAGDAWRGGFIAGLCKNYLIKDCLKLGNVIASFAVESYGTVNHKPTQKQINHRLSTL